MAVDKREERMLNILGRTYQNVELPTHISHSGFLDYTACQRYYALTRLLKVPYKVTPIMDVGRDVATIMLTSTLHPSYHEGDIKDMTSGEVERAIIEAIAPAFREQFRFSNFSPEVKFSRSIVENPDIELTGVLDGYNEELKRFIEFKYTGDKRGLATFSSVPLGYQLTTYFWLSGAERCTVAVLKRPYVVGIVKRFTRIETALAHFAESAAKRPGMFLSTKQYLAGEYSDYYTQVVDSYKQCIREVYMKLNKGHEFLPSPTKCGNCSLRQVCETGVIPEREE